MKKNNQNTILVGLGVKPHGTQVWLCLQLIASCRGGVKCGEQFSHTLNEWGTLSFEEAQIFQTLNICLVKFIFYPQTVYLSF